MPLTIELPFQAYESRLIFFTNADERLPPWSPPSANPEHSHRSLRSGGR